MAARDMSCPICSTLLAHHDDEPCLHAWVAALMGEWVATAHDDIYCFFPCEPGRWCVYLPVYTAPEHVWPMLVELAGRRSEVRLDSYVISDEDDDGNLLTEDDEFAVVREGNHVSWDEPTPELAVVKAWIAMKSETK